MGSYIVKAHKKKKKILKSPKFNWHAMHSEMVITRLRLAIKSTRILIKLCRYLHIKQTIW